MLYSIMILWGVILIFFFFFFFWEDKQHSPMRKVIWKPPPNGWIKLNFDARQEKTSLTIVGIDDKGDLIFA